MYYFVIQGCTALRSIKRHTTSSTGKSLQRVLLGPAGSGLKRKKVQGAAGIPSKEKPKIKKPKNDQQDSFNMFVYNIILDDCL